ncbi:MULTISPECIES: outer membrane lipoprotein carrier protein LolA [Acetobacter]|uniref:Outer Membrane Lipoprotein Carrier Protein LolA n=1 Tax=Acetobacter pomorum DM001 TaxID=945681 RepID=F1YTP9_9PROT|nr:MULTISPECIES: outer membrane lipoprotein carrier protein LolA [Acetobacter]ATI13030.1 outer membrane lipoprotein carrier protein LolA [Acetobacter pomorum]AXC26854.1 outer membrane lipoprotein carrier protein LolA [Acetobacter sp. JWB]EGE47764.1 Outer Membrane Lipoprotein Carrier Protein LolA [Acetobacter pomorum DM001]KAA8429159.1 outer membrane lipoprotein carrier protein LolA [Acetobacter pomorum]KAA8436327.1 outer membrane lipoprotein carrier protein LolA [Acetobacter pomorum]
MFHMKETTFMKSIFRAVLPAAMGLVLAGSQAYAQDDTGETAIPVAPSSAPAAVALSASDKAWLKRIEQALNQSKTFQARIQQLDAEGKRTTGTVWMKRPGQMRLAYDPPSPLLLVANGGKVVFRDNQLDQTTVIPIERTPLGLLLRPHVSLTDDVTVTGFQHDNGLVQVTLVRTSSPGDGSLTLVFYETPVALRSWSVLDAQGRETRVTLFDVHAGADIPASTFVLPAEND